MDPGLGYRWTPGGRRTLSRPSWTSRIETDTGPLEIAGCRDSEAHNRAALSTEVLVPGWKHVVREQLEGVARGVFVADSPIAGRSPEPSSARVPFPEPAECLEILETHTAPDVGRGDVGRGVDSSKSIRSRRRKTENARIL